MDNGAAHLITAICSQEQAIAMGDEIVSSEAHLHPMPPESPLGAKYQLTPVLTGGGGRTAFPPPRQHATG